MPSLGYLAGLRSEFTWYVKWLEFLIRNEQPIRLRFKFSIFALVFGNSIESVHLLVNLYSQY